jgi:prevent-host-death family protein
MSVQVPEGPRLRALLVHEGELEEARMPAAAARNAGFDLVEVKGDRGALRAIESDSIDVVVSDIRLSTTGGADLLRAIRARWHGPMVLLTAAADKNRAAVQAAELGGAQSLVMPIESETLERVLKLTLRSDRPKRILLAAFYNRRGERVIPTPFTATDAKKEFGRALDITAQGGMVVVTKHDDAKAVMLSVDEFNALVAPGASRLDDLRREFDVMLGQMQKPSVKAAMKAAFGAAPEALGKAAVSAASKRG